MFPYESRKKAGELLADFISEKYKEFYNKIKNNIHDYFLYAIPNGGVPVAEGFCQTLKIKYDILIVRKLKIPYNTEAGFGAVTTDGTVITNEALLSQLNLSQEQIENAIKMTKDEIQERINSYKKKTITEEIYRNCIYNKYIFIMDDGLASGYTMFAGINMIKKYHPKEIYIAVPTAPLHTLNKIKKEVTNDFCPNIRETRWFAVADAYRHWYDVSDSEVLEIIKKSPFYMENT
jgi:predicted phosphoribosyltransferase